MPALGRNTRPLLHTVRGKEHATADDHEPDPFAADYNDDDLLRSPKGSSDDDTNCVSNQATPVTKLTDRSSPDISTNRSLSPQASQVSKFRSPLNLRQSSRTNAKPKGGQLNTPVSSIPNSSSSNNVSLDSDDDGDIFDQVLGRGPTKRRKVVNGCTNIHAPKQTYGKQSVPKTRGKAAAGNNGFRAPDTRWASQSSQPIADEFKIPGAGLLRERPRKQDEGQFIVPPKLGLKLPQDSFKREENFKVPKGSLSQSESGSSLSSPQSTALSPRHLPLSPPRTDSGTVCPYCKVPVEEALLTNFIREHNKNSSNMKTKVAAIFCGHHKRAAALEEYKERGYPEIDWLQLPQRMSRHLPRVRKILLDEKRSYYRDRLAQRLRDGLRPDQALAKGLYGAGPVSSTPDCPSTPPATERSTGKETYTGSSTGLIELIPGYYGTRGGTEMTAFIMNELADDLRVTAAEDRLVAGAAGGVVGFVQSVLMMELAVSLVMEDMALADEDVEAKARTILDESAELGYVIHDEDIR